MFSSFDCPNSLQDEYILASRFPAKTHDQRPAFDAICKDATKRESDTVMARSVDRLGCSLKELVAFLSELHALRIDLFLIQQGLDTRTPAGKAMFQMMGVFAERRGRCRVTSIGHAIQHENTP